MFWGYLLCWLPFLLSVLHCTPHTNVNQGYTLYPITYNAVNSCFSLISFVCMRVRACVFAVTTGARSFTNMEKYQAVYVHACIFVWKVACECGYLHRRQKVLCHAAWLAEKKKASKREPSLFPCHCWVGRTLPGAPASSWRHTGYQLVCAGAPQHIVPVSQTKGKVGASSYRKLSWQPPFLIKNALTLNAPINLSRLYLARVASCTVYKTQQLKQVILASSRPSRA